MSELQPTEPVDETIADPIRVSVVVPFHGPQSELDPCISALTASEHDSFEIIIADDGSPTPVTPPCRVVRLPRRCGPAAARNAGAKIARGDLLIFIDADVIVSVENLTEFERSFRTSRAVAVQACYRYPGLDTNIATRFLEDFQEYKVHSLDGNEIRTLRGGCFAIARETFENVGGFEERFKEPSQEDTDLGWRVAATGGRIVCDRSIRVLHNRSMPGLWALWRRYHRLFRSMIALRLRARRNAKSSGAAGPRPENTMSRADQSWKPLGSLAAIGGFAGGLVLLGTGVGPGTAAGLIGGSVALYALLNLRFLHFVGRRRGAVAVAGETIALVGFHLTLVTSALSLLFSESGDRF